MDLLPHQYRAIERIVARCKKQHGLLLYHLMGTGKTLTSIVIMMNFPKNDIAIFCPRNLTYVWTKEIKKYDFQHPKDLNIQIHENIFDADLKNKIVVIDEVHNLVSMFLTNDDQNRIIEFIEKLKHAHKVILLTGTPIYNDITDLSILVNMAAGKKIGPYTKQEMTKKYMKMSRFKSILMGYILPILSTGFGYLLLDKIANKTSEGFFRKYDAQIKNIIAKMMKKHENLLDLSILQLPVRLILLGFLDMIINIHQHFPYYQLKDYKIEELANDMGPYVEFYRPMKTSGFPIKKNGKCLRRV